MDKINDNQPIKISIIIPFYDSENYVARCLDSVLAQDMSDFEIIAVNDGSPDSTPSLLEKYAEKDSRIQVINLKNGGIGWARNQGVLKAKGEYIMFIDGDDFIMPSCLSALYNYTQLNNADVVIFTYMPWRDGIFSNPHQYSYPKDIIFNSLTATKLMLLEGDYTVWNKIIRHKLYVEKNICFEEGTLAEDPPVSFKMLNDAHRIIYFDKAFYAYVQRSTSQSNSPLTAKGIRDLIYSLDFIEKEMQKSCRKYELANVFEYRYIWVLIGLLQTCYSNPKQYKSPEELQQAKVFLKERFSKISWNRIFSNDYLKNSYKLKAIRLKTGLYKYEKALTRFFN